MLPHVWQRLFRIVRVLLGLSCVAVELANSHLVLTETTAFFGIYTIYGLLALFWKGLEDSGYALLALLVDTLFSFCV